MLIDNPAASREIVACTGARPTHPGADVMHGELREQLEEYSKSIGRVFDPIWNCMCGEDGAASDRDECVPSRTEPREVSAGQTLKYEEAIPHSAVETAEDVQEISV
jgi:hypothetical protein